ncbi:lanthionine synthetase C family protein [Flindersiella endophytica]
MSRDRAAEVVALVAEQLADPAAVAVDSSVAGSVDGRTTPGWEPASLAEGHPGIALLHAELGDRRAAHAHLVAANQARAPEPAGSRHHLSGGRLPGLLLAATGSASRPGEYAGLIGKAGSAVAEAVLRTASAELERAALGKQGTTFAAYDVLSGLAGATRLLLACGGQADAVEQAVRALVAVAGPLADGRPGWYVEHGWVGPDDRTGHLNLGLAHGVPGVLAALAVAYRDGVLVPGQAEAMERIVRWLLAQSPDAVTWPEIVAADGTVLGGSGDRPGWCYGVPGLARALQLAGSALDVPAWRTTAVHALATALARPWSGFGMADAGLCHGWGGLLQVTLRMSRDSGDARLAAAVEGLADRVVEQHDAAAPFGFGHPGFLLGAAGTALALHTYATDRPPVTGWDLALLLT